MTKPHQTVLAYQPLYTEPVSSDEEEYTIPDAIAFNHTAQGLKKTSAMQIHPHIPNTHTPTLDTSAQSTRDSVVANSNQVAPSCPSGMQNRSIPMALMPNISTAPNWSTILSAVQGLGLLLDLPVLQTALSAPPVSDDFGELRHIFKAETMKLEYELNARTLPKQIL